MTGGSAKHASEPSLETHSLSALTQASAEISLWSRGASVYFIALMRACRVMLCTDMAPAEAIVWQTVGHTRVEQNGRLIRNGYGCVSSDVL